MSTTNATRLVYACVAAGYPRTTQGEGRRANSVCVRGVATERQQREIRALARKLHPGSMEFATPAAGYYVVTLHPEKLS